MARILVIDDDKTLNDMLVLMFSKAGYESEGASDGDSGLKLLEKKQFDLIVTDIVMPEKEGLETIRAIRKKGKTIPIIAISSGGKKGGEQYLIAARHFGANYTLQKPIDMKALLGVVEECLGGIAYKPST